MRVLIDCTRCGRRLRVAEESLGTAMECPRCGEEFIAPDVGLPDAQPDAPSKPRPRPRLGSEVEAVFPDLPLPHGRASPPPSAGKRPQRELTTAGPSPSQPPEKHR